MPSGTEGPKTTGLSPGVHAGNRAHVPRATVVLCGAKHLLRAVTFRSTPPCAAFARRSTERERSPMRKQLSVVTKIWIVLALTAGAATGIVSADRSRAADGSAVVRVP